jgi:hypothetical protein
MDNRVLRRTQQVMVLDLPAGQHDFQVERRNGD